MSKNLSLLADFYEFTMSNALYVKNMSNNIAYFDVFFRKIPDNGGYVIFAGLEQIIEYIKNAYEKAKNILTENIESLHKISAFLLEKETITGKEFMDILNEADNTEMIDEEEQ